MILAAILRNYKCYKGINIIPFCGDDVQDMNIIIGNNGVGKSAILEGLDTFFNEAPWIVNKIGFVSPARRYEAPTVARPPQM